MAFLGPFAHDIGAHGIAYYARTLGSEAIARQDPSRDPAPHAHGLWILVGGDPTRVDAETVFAAAQASDPLAADIIERAITTPARAIAILALVLNPELVVIGGAVAKAGNVLLEPLARHLEQLTRLPPRLEASTLAERGVLVGAVRHALDHVEPRLLDGLGQVA
jgi:predicted NBD/HSP70 family sugar kinase